uniref:Uncharacterized protein n=1 Tax=Rhizophora mucronata TaxID=61149 RepID=A0A2P2QGU1_RHIMU
MHKANTDNSYNRKSGYRVTSQVNWLAQGQ